MISYYDELYVNSRRTIKYHWALRGFGIGTSTFGTDSHEIHRNRRAAVAPYFSKASVYQLEPIIQSIVDKLESRLTAIKGTGTVLNLIDVFTSLTADVIVQYTFAKPYGFMDSPDFDPHWYKVVMDVCEMSLIFKQFGWMESMMRKIPPWVVEKMNPQLSALTRLETVCKMLKVCSMSLGLSMRSDGT